MHRIRLDNELGSCSITVGACLDSLREFCHSREPVVITDRNVMRLYGDMLSGFDLVGIPAGEGHKTLETVHGLYLEFLRREMDRSSLVVAVGGGVVCDVAGFAAATFLRGVDVAYVATTLLAQADAAVGGKNGVNIGGYKNQVGTFFQPRFVLCDPVFLGSLSRSELANGYAEIVKHALLGDEALFGLFEKLPGEPGGDDKVFLEEIVHRSLMVKVRVVTGDGRERGERRLLNLGHTIGHALEKVAGVSHGEAVSAGTVVAAEVSLARGYLGRPDVDRIKRVLTGVGLPVAVKADGQAVAEAVRKDKKREGKNLRFVLPDGIGAARIETISLDEIEEVIHVLC